MLGLRHLSIGSLLEKLPVFTNLPELVNLTLINNRIQEISLQSLVHFRKLMFLNMNNNRIETVNFTAANSSQVLSRMSDIELKNNSITTLPANAFANLTYLYFLDLS